MKEEKSKRLVMVEHLNGDNEWAWFAVIDNATPKEAVRWYMRGHGLDEGERIAFKEDGGTVFGESETQEARAYEIHITSI